MSVSDDLNAAADYIEEHGWYQGDFCNLAGNVCMLGAMRAVVGVGPSILVLMDSVHDTIGIGDIGTWNDHPMRTKDEVVQALRDAAIKNQPDSMWG